MKAIKFDLVVTRHTGLVEFLREEELIDESTPVLASATAEDVKGKHVVGVLPLWLAASAASVTEAKLELTVEDRGKEMSAAETREKFRGFFRYETRLVAEQHERVAVLDFTRRQRGRAYAVGFIGDKGTVLTLNEAIDAELAVQTQVERTANGKWSKDIREITWAKGLRLVDVQEPWEGWPTQEQLFFGELLEQNPSLSNSEVEAVAKKLLPNTFERVAPRWTLAEKLRNGDIIANL